MIHMIPVIKNGIYPRSRRIKYDNLVTRVTVVDLVGRLGVCASILA